MLTPTTLFTTLAVSPKIPMPRTNPWSRLETMDAADVSDRISLAKAKSKSRKRFFFEKKKQKTFPYWL
jgi:hypothetical protein